jgi:hypothetical protein
MPHIRLLSVTVWFVTLFASAPGQNVPNPVQQELIAAPTEASGKP